MSTNFKKLSWEEIQKENPLSIRLYGEQYKFIKKIKDNHKEFQWQEIINNIITIIKEMDSISNDEKMIFITKLRTRKRRTQKNSFRKITTKTIRISQENYDWLKKINEKFPERSRNSVINAIIELFTEKFDN